MTSLKDTVESIAKAIVAQQKSLDSPAKVVLDNRRAVVYLAVEQGGANAVANTTCCSRINSSGRWKFNDLRPLSKLFGLKG